MDMKLSDRLCCCLDVGTGSLLAGIYTCFLSLAFIAIGIDSLVEVYTDSHRSSALTTLSVVYGLLVGLSVLYGIASVSLVLGASQKYKTYVISWVVLTPLWTIIALCALVILPAVLSDAIILTNPVSRICGTAFVMLMNVFCMICVSIFLATLVKKSPKHILKKMGVMEALESGFSNGYSRLRESIRPKSKGVARYSKRSSVQPPEVTLPAPGEATSSNVAVVLNPKSLDTPRSDARRGDITYSQFVNEGGDESFNTSSDNPSSGESKGVENAAFHDI